MNRPPKDGIPVPAGALRELVEGLAQRAGMGETHAALLAELLVSNDLRGVFSHGSRQIATYARDLRDGKLNPRPEVRTVAESPATLLLDGDGGLGYFPSWPAAHALVEKARAVGIAAAVTRHHGHFGAAGLYTRVAAGAGLIGYDTSGHQLHLQPGQPLLAAAGGSPMSFAVPAGEAPPLVLDFGAIHDLYRVTTEQLQWLMEHMPSTLFRSFGLGTVCQSLGGFLAGVPVDEARAQRRFPGANQGALFIVLDPARFIDPRVLQREMEEYHRLVRQLQPFPGTEGAELAGSPEWRREREWAVSGVPVGGRHREELSAVAAEFDVPVPW
ncbi:MAG TPA: Ldh family oxidoreductase [Chloroflexota bacterium]|nr:Ldh family oxidoreductase [Chloroflexota bacterium]